MKPVKISLLLLSGLCALGFVSPPSLHFYRFQSSGWQPSTWQTGAVTLAETRGDLNQDGTEDELTLLNGVLEIRSGDELLYRSDPNWEVKQAEFGDLNRDGQPEAALLVWRAFEPWPVDRLLPSGGRIADFHDAAGRSCHIILMAWSQKSMREAWAGSALESPVLGFVNADLDGDGREELITMDGNYNNAPGLPANRVKIWEWNGFGFTRLEQIDLPARQIYVSKSNDGSTGLIIVTD